MSDIQAAAEERVPALRGATWQGVGDGWTCDTFEVRAADGVVWIVQSPRSPYAAERLRLQAAVLPELAREVSAAVPEPASEVGEPPLLIYRRIDGEPCSTSGGGMWPERLGRFLYDLHAVPPEFLGLRAETVAVVRDRTRASLAALLDEISPVFQPDEQRSIAGVVHDLCETDDMWSFAPCVTHRDLGPAHVLTDAGGELAGVIDWEEVGIDDPSLDLAWWLFATPSHGERILGAYGGAPDRAFLDRARLRFVIMPWYEIAYGLRGGGEDFVASGLAGARERLERHR